ncbi:type 2 isopentenyl-diphosphate Delta-isomerase [Jeotgalibacillus haloalkalitolerans]|uniref:Isopentenyl-diphosphate delta-isomerase n=1 Tax=Jeotgalibacillus haloalkalitolerans TaxID=3104292 RepID=A0ABU5KLA2_9BACL|nr:type 2 isopentenyl-diphosphate Delta-isomerase [Jeotgalibacillus sp. HH7-29]MDZ5712024.1 type 2 isopentenyl-diphosphate Delta-isomerase [Jeotgalibacillus sp. HH7-29]
MSRAKRKLDHIQYALSDRQSGMTGFDELMIVHQSLPDTAVDEVSLHSEVGGLLLSSPFFINAMTGGGGEKTSEINAALARAAKDTGIALSVGSQMSAIKDRQERHTYQVVRKENPDGLIFGNIGSEATVAQAVEAAEMIEADALQIHLNVIQELAMPEGDRSFNGALERIARIADELPIPVIVKETGFGISREAAQKLDKTSIRAIDAGGYGGTNFSSIENNRQERKKLFFNDWGIPTAASILETASVTSKDVLASGGIHKSSDVLKSLILGASAAGIAGSFLRILTEQGEKQLVEEIKYFQEDLIMMMTALGCKSVADLHRVPVVIKGDLYHWLSVRGLNPELLSRRS